VSAESIVAAGAIGAITYVDGEIETAGFANLATGEAFSPQHRIRVGSIDKTFISIVALDVFDDLTVTAEHWLPELDGRITLHHLLSHRSGLFDYMWDGEMYERLAFGPPEPADPEAYLQAALRYPLRNFGEVDYSSSNYAALDLILERETGRPLGDLIREHVIEPFALRHTTFQTGLQVPADVARGYALKGGTFPAVDSPRDVSEYWTDRSIASDVFDLASFFTQVVRRRPEMVDGGYGIRTYDRFYGHGGTMAGYTTQAWTSRDGDHVVVVAANSHSIPLWRELIATTRELL
jgi:D-alanyl-D-alanine carboxypeptidase